MYFLKCCWYTHKIVEVIRKLFSQILSNLKSVYKYALASFNFWIISKHTDKWYNVPAITYGIRHGDSTWWQGMRQDLMYPKWYQPLHYPPSPWNWVVPHHWCLRPLLFQRTAVWVLLRPKIITTTKSSETDTTVCHPCPRRLECLTICRCHNKGSTFSSVILRPCMLVRLVCTRDLPLGRPVLIHLN